VGDPLVLHRHPQSIQLSGPAKTRAAEDLVVRGYSPIAGRCTVELTVAPGRLRISPPARPDFPSTAQQMAEFQEVYCQANDLRLACQQRPVSAGPFEVRLAVPAEASGACCVRAYVEGRDDFALGAARVEVQGLREGRP